MQISCLQTRIPLFPDKPTVSAVQGKHTLTACGQQITACISKDINCLSLSRADLK